MCVPGTSAPGWRTIPFNPEPSRKAGGWSADRQRLFIETLAETGSVHQAARSAGLSARSAYFCASARVRFAATWDAAQQLAVGRLSALAFDRAIHGRVEQVYHEGNLVGERRIPSERLLMWLLGAPRPAAASPRHGSAARTICPIPRPRRNRSLPAVARPP